MKLIIIFGILFSVICAIIGFIHASLIVYKHGFRIKIVKDKYHRAEYYKPVYYRKDYPDGIDFEEALSVSVEEEKYLQK